jgi:hypothetical protein
MRLRDPSGRLLCASSIKTHLWREKPVLASPALVASGASTVRSING